MKKILYKTDQNNPQIIEYKQALERGLKNQHMINSTKRDGKVSMNIESHVTSLELSKKLKKLGFPQKSVYTWCEAIDKSGVSLWKRVLDINGIIDYKTAFKEKGEAVAINGLASAYLASELGDLKPGTFHIVKLDKNKWESMSVPFEIEKRFEAETMANSIAKMFIWLKENGYLNPL